MADAALLVAVALSGGVAAPLFARRALRALAPLPVGGRRMWALIAGAIGGKAAAVAVGLLAAAFWHGGDSLALLSAASAASWAGAGVAVLLPSQGAPR